MRNRGAVIVLIVMAVILWAGLLVFTRQQPPQGANLAVFLVVWGLCVSTTMIPVTYALGTRLARSQGARHDINRAIRQGLLIGVLAIILMALRLIRVLRLSTALILSLVVVLIEVMLSLRERR